MSAGPGHFPILDGLSAEFRQRLVWVTLINFGMFVVEMGAGSLAGSQALRADALDFFAHGATYALSFWAIGRPAAARSGAALLRGAVLFAMGVWIAVTTLYQFFVRGLPEAEVMGAIGFVALAANLLSVYLLLPHKAHPAWLGARNDTIGNVAVMLAAGLVLVLNNGVPDLIVAGVMAALFISASYPILTQSWREWQARDDDPERETP
jgi:Co/Zn/Cd efflux system component